MDPGRSFDTDATLYDAHRSGYPEQLFADLSAIAALEPGARVLEIGCGSGQATAGLASRGFEITAIDPGPSLIEIARHRFESSTSARFAVASFEDWPLQPGRFRLVAAAQSWHWVRADIGFRKAADSLVSGGHLAIFGHTPRWSTELIGHLKAPYTRLAPEMWAPPAENWYLPEGPIPGILTASGFFADVVHRGYVWRRRYSAGSFATYLGTRSDHLRLPTERRENLLASIEASLPQEIDADWVTNMYVAAVQKV